jgi:hypothetical protein
MKSLLLSNKTEQTSSSTNLQSLTKAKKHFQKLSYKTLITSSDFDKNKNRHKYLNTDNLGGTVKKINFIDSSQINSVCHTNENLNNTKSQPTKIFPKYNPNNETPNIYYKKNEDKKKVKQSSIDLQNRYTNIVNKNYYKNCLKEKNISLNYRKNLSEKKQNEKNLKKSIVEKDKNIKENKIKDKGIKKSFTPSTLRTEESEKIYKDESKNKESIILSSISTFKTLFNVKEKKERKIISKEQKNELEELTNKLKSIPINQKTKKNNIKKNDSNELKKQKNEKEKEKENKYNIINADMLEETIIKNEKESKIKKEIISSSEQRIQTYTLLLECISKKFKEIEDLLDPEEEKISELHSKIEFTNNEENTDSMTTIINFDERNINNSCDCEDEEIQEKSNIIIPKGENIKKVNYNNKERILTDNNFNRVNSNTIFFDVTSLSMNSEILKRTINDNNDFVSFLSNDMISFFQPGNNFKISDINELKDKIPKKEKENKNEDNNNCNIF